MSPDEKVPARNVRPLWQLLLFNRLSGALVVAAVTALVLICLNWWIPEEDAPTVRLQPNGATEYYLQTLRHSILVPVGILTVFGAATGFAVVQQRVLGLAKKEWSSEAPSTFLGRLGLAVGCGICAVLLLLIGLLVLWRTILVPAHDIRSVVVGKETIELRSLLASWTIPANHIEGVEVIQRPAGARSRKEFHVQIRSKLGVTWRTVELTMRETDPEFQDEVKLLEDLKQALLTRR